MNELIHEAFSLHNLPVTLLLGAVLLYWLLVIVGLADVDDGGGADVDAHGDTGHHGHEGGLLSSAGRFFHLGVVPFMIVLSVMSLFLWSISILANYHFNGAPGQRSHLMALGLLVPNVLISALATRLILLPLRGFFSRLNDGAQEESRIIGREGVVISAQVDHLYGQIELTTAGAPMLMNARTAGDTPPIPRGTTVIVHDSAPDHAWYYVRPASTPDA